MSVMNSQNDVISQLGLYNENKVAFISSIGDDVYNPKIIQLLIKLPDPSIVNSQAAGDVVDSSIDGSDEYMIIILITLLCFK